MKKSLKIFILLLSLVLLTACSDMGAIENEEFVDNGSSTSSNEKTKADLSQGLLRIHYLDVGQGESIFIQTPQQENILIDAGNDEEGEKIIAYLKKEGVEKLDRVIATHPHADHIGGLDKVMKAIDTEMVILPNVVHTSKNFQEMIEVIEEKKITAKEAKAGLDLGLEKLEAKLVAPNSTGYKSMNNYSAVLHLKYGENAFLFTGDAEKDSEREILQNNFPIKSDVLNVGHHGSTTSTSSKFLEKVAPKYAVISLGKDNSYGHPHREIVELLEKKNIEILRTDLLGNIVLESDGRSLEFFANGQSLSKAGKSGEATEVTNPPLTSSEPAEVRDVRITEVELVKEYVVLKNFSDKDVDISAWTLLSVKGEQKFIFPKNTVIKAQDSLTIRSGKDLIGDEKTLIWPENNIWNNKGDPAILFNEKGEKVSFFDEKGVYNGSY